MRLPKTERGSFYHPYQYSQKELEKRKEKERKKREFTTIYYEYTFDAQGNCICVLHQYGDEV